MAFAKHDAGWNSIQTVLQIAFGKQDTYWNSIQTVSQIAAMAMQSAIAQQTWGYLSESITV